MFLSTYFSSISAIIHQQNFPAYAMRMFAGNWTHALQCMQNQRENDESAHSARPVQDIQAMCAIGDAMLVIGHLEEAEESYRLVHKCARTNVRVLRILSCRNTAWQMLIQHRFSAAMNCFTQVEIDDQATVLQRVEASVGKAITHLSLGQGALAMHIVAQAKELLTPAESSLAILLDALILDIRSQLALRRCPRLTDHVFWQATGLSKDSMLDVPVEENDFLQITSQLDDSNTILLRRLEFLHLLLQISAGKVSLFQHGMDSLPTTVNGASVMMAQSAKLELAMATLGAGRADLAERAVAGIVNRNSFRWDLDLDYCQAKIAQSRGHAEHALRLYYRYAMDAVHCLRNEAQNQRTEQMTENTNINDDISARLPAKYRRAYSFMISNAHRPDLSVSEIAAQIGVTGRALQLAFKAATGLSPTQVLRRYRMQSIRADLLENGGCGGVLQAANRWGVASRSVLAKGYRQEFNEAPVDTLQR